MIGTDAGSGPSANALTGCGNVIIGAGRTVPVPSGSGQLVLGSWLTGCSNGNLDPAAGIVDCNISAGCAWQVMKSTGANNIVWGSPYTGGTYNQAIGTAVAVGSRFCARMNGNTPQVCATASTCVTWTTSTYLAATITNCASAGSTITTAWTTVGADVTNFGNYAKAVVADNTNSCVWEITFMRTLSGQMIRAIPLN
jgi:hypothetical protein